MSFSLDHFIEKNNLVVDRVEMKQLIEQAMNENELVGFVCKGNIGGMIPAQLQTIGTNAGFSNGIYVSYGKEAPCTNATLYLIPRVLNLGLTCEQDATLEDIEAFLEELAKTTGIFKQAIKTISIDACEMQFAVEGYEMLQLEKEWWENAVEPLSQTDQMLGKKNDETVSERLAICGLKDGHLLCKEQSYGLVKGALAVGNWQITFEK